MANGLPNDSTEYKQIAEANSYSHFLVLEGDFDNRQIRLGQSVSNLSAQVRATRYLYAPQKLTFRGNERQIPHVWGRLKICVVNVENFYIDPNQYAGPQTKKQCYDQASKITKALAQIDADIYALAEVEQRTAALDTLVKRMNTLTQSTKFEKLESDVGNSATSYNRVCFIYNKNKVRANTTTYSPYDSRDYKHRILFAQFEEKATQEKFVLCMNHFRSKRDGSARETDSIRMLNAEYLLDRIETNMPSAIRDSDILLVGDFNNYTKEAPNQLILSHGYYDETMRFAPNGYSYVYAYQVGYLDHVFANEKMHPQVEDVVAVHINADEPESLEYTTGDNSMYRFSDHDPLLIGITLGDTSLATSNIAEETVIINQHGLSIRIQTEKAIHASIYNETGQLIARKKIDKEGTLAVPGKGLYIVDWENGKRKIAIL